MLARITPGPAGFDIRTFECPACDHIHQRVVELIDPMKSKETAGWLAGELRAPNWEQRGRPPKGRRSTWEEGHGMV